jgi:hypothetical protein
MIAMMETPDHATIARFVDRQEVALAELFGDELFGEERGDELPQQLRTREGRAEFFRRARELHAAETTSEDQLGLDGAAPQAEVTEFAFDTEQIIARHQGRDGWAREGRRPAPAAPGRRSPIKSRPMARG